MDALFTEFEIYAPLGQLYEPVDADLLLSYREAQRRPDPRGGHHRGRLDGVASPPPARRTPPWGQPMIPFFIFYSMFGFQRVGDLIWAFGDQRGPRLPARRHRRPHHAARARACSTRTATASLLRVDRPELPGLRPGVRLRARRDRPRRHPSACTGPSPRTASTTSPSTTRTTCMPADARRRRGRHRARPLPLPRRRPDERTHRAADPRQRHRRCCAALEAQQMLAERLRRRAPTCGARPATSSCARTRSSAERWNRLHPDRAAAHAVRHRAARRRRGPDRRGHRLHEGGARPDRPLRARSRSSSLGTDGFGRSDTRAALRRHFEVDAAAHRRRRARTGSRRPGDVKAEVVADAITPLRASTPTSVDPRLT